MRKLWLATVLIIVSLFSIAIPAKAATTGCSISPNPIIINQPWSASIFGFVPNATYWLRFNQPKDESNNSHPQDFVTTDASGTAIVSYQGTNISPDFILKVGAGSLHVSPVDWDPNARGTTNCKFTVTEG